MLQNSSRCYLSGNFGVNGILTLAAVLIYTQLWAGRRFVLVTIGFVGVAVFVFVSIGGQVLPAWQLWCELNSLRLPSCSFRSYLTGNFGANGNSLWLQCLYTPSSRRAVDLFWRQLDLWGSLYLYLWILDLWQCLNFDMSILSLGRLLLSFCSSRCYLSGNFGATENSMWLPYL